MNLKIYTPKVMLVAGIILFAAIMRLIPHYPNFTPIAAIALFGGAHLGKKWLSFLIPIVALFISDLILGFHGFMIPVYASFIVVVLFGNYLRNNIKVHTVGVASIAASTLFFIITNFAVWIATPYYPANFSGLVACYAAAIPFFHTGILGDLFYSTVFFGGFYLVQQYVTVFKTKEI
ncbi:MAG: hypothetical protein KGZ97_00560 [Bacteroidetes bacterium]|nr:hypothetical protein [Bacteroidota bacterium]